MTTTVPTSEVVSDELWSIFDARRVKAPEMRGLDAGANALIGMVKNHRPVLPRLKAQAARIEKLEPEIHNLSAARFQEEVNYKLSRFQPWKVKTDRQNQAEFNLTK